MPFADYQLQSYWFTNSLGVNTYGWLYEPKGAQPIIANKRGIVSRTNRFQLTWSSMGYMYPMDGWVGGWEGGGSRVDSDHEETLTDAIDPFSHSPYGLVTDATDPVTTHNLH